MAMTSPLQWANGTDAFGILQPLARVPRRWSQTSLNASIVAHCIADIISEWDGATTSIPVDDPAPRASRYPTDPVEAVAFISSVLQISQDDVLHAAGIAERTFFGWKTRGHRPRKTSTGRLWALTDALFYLRGSHPNLAGWYHSEPRAQAAFTEGDANRFVDLELDWALRQQPTRPPAASDFGDAGDWPPHDMPPARRTFTSESVDDTPFQRR